MYNDNVDYSEVYDIHLNFVIQNINDNLNIKLNKKIILTNILLQNANMIVHKDCFHDVDNNIDSLFNFLFKENLEKAEYNHIKDFLKHIKIKL